MNRMDEKRRQKRAAIMDAAQRVFRDDGYVGAGMDDIARRAGVTKQTVYRYFPSKEALFHASLEARRESTSHAYLEALAGPDPREALHAFALGFLRLHVSEEHLAIIRLLVSEGPTAPEITRSHFILGPGQTRGRLTAFLQRHYSLDDPEHAATMLLGALLSLRMSVLVGLRSRPTEQELERHVERTLRLFSRITG